MFAVVAWVTGDPISGSAATEKFISTAVKLVDSVQGNHDEVIAAFGVRLTVQHGNVKAQWIPILFVDVLSAGDVKATMTANGGGSNYVLTFGVSDASQMQVNGGLLGKQSGSFRHVGISTITNGTSALPATLLESGDNRLLAQLWDVASSGQFVEKSRVDGHPATALATTSANIGLADDRDFNEVKEVAMDFWKIGTASLGGPPTPESIVVAAATMADSSLGLFQFGASVNTVIVG
jgi:hypothetical protein